MIRIYTNQDVTEKYFVIIPHHKVTIETLNLKFEHRILMSNALERFS